MKIFYNTIIEDSLPVRASFSFTEDGEGYEVTEFLGNIHKNIDNGVAVYFLIGSGKAVLSCGCDMCAKDISVPIVFDIEVSLDNRNSANATPEYELSDEDGNTYNTAKEFVDLEDIIRQEVLLQAPTQRLCAPDCEGLDLLKEYNSADIEKENPFSKLSSLKKR